MQQQHKRKGLAESFVTSIYVLNITRAIQTGFANFGFKPAPATPPATDETLLRSTPYSVSLAQSFEDRHAAYQLRFRVSNLELNEGLQNAYATGEDMDEFDSFCDHLIVRDETTGIIVETYRLQTGRTAQRNLGYYSAREFDFTPYESLSYEMVELGRACIHPDHRKHEVLMLLWKAIARYAVDRGARYLIGCSSVTSQDVNVGSALYDSLKSTLAPEHLRTVPTEPYSFPLSECIEPVRAPKLLRAYLSVGAHICGPPALDHEFRTIDFLTLMDLSSLSPAIRRRLFGR